jgi:hypothetical protein
VTRSPPVTDLAGDLRIARLYLLDASGKRFVGDFFLFAKPRACPETQDRDQ